VSLFASAQTMTEGDKVTFNLSVAGGDYDLERLKYRWRIYPKGRLLAGERDTVVVLDTSTVRGHWAIVSGRRRGVGNQLLEVGIARVGNPAKGTIHKSR
jgi:hypothetical protein